MSTNVQKRDNGLWYDPTKSGAGFDLRTLDDATSRQFSFFYSGAIRGLFDRVAWFSIQGEPDTAGHYPLILTVDAILGEAHPFSYAVVGSVSFLRQDDDHIRAVVTVTGNGDPQFSPAPARQVDTFALVRVPGIDA